MRRLAAVLILCLLAEKQASAERSESDGAKVPWCYVGKVRFKNGYQSSIGTRLWEMMNTPGGFDPSAYGKEWWDGMSGPNQWVRITTALGPQAMKKIPEETLPAVNEDPCSGEKKKKTEKQASGASEASLSRSQAKRNAQRESERLRSEARKRVPKLVKDGLDFLVKGDMEAAKEKLGAAVKADPSSVDARLGFSVLLKLTGDRENSDRHMERALRMEQKSPTRLRKMLSQKAQVPSKKNVRKLKDPWLAIADGLIQEALGEPDKALENYNTAIFSGPGIWLGYALRGILKIEHKDCPGALDDLDQAVRLNFIYKPQARYYQSRCGS